MSFLSRLFGKGSGGGKSRDVEAELARLEAEAERAAPGYVGSAHNRAGDLALRSGQPDRAVAYYGRAIDAFLLDAQREAARGVANKIIRVRPSAVRTLCTLTWLDLAARHHATALLHLRDYVEAAREVDEVARAATEIYGMARVVPDVEFGNAVADALDGLDYTVRAREVRSWAEAGAPDAVDDPVRLSEACVAAAVRSTAPEDLLVREREAGDADGEVRGSGDPATSSDGPRAGMDPEDGSVQDDESSEDDASVEDDASTRDDTSARDGASAPQDTAPDGPAPDGPGPREQTAKGTSKKSRKRKKKGRPD